MYTSIFIKAIAEIAGPGQNPTSPQPIPNILDPKIKFLSTSFFKGRIKDLANIGLDFLLNVKWSGEKINIAPIITNISEGSQASNIFKKPKTFWGLTIPEIVSPTPKIMPDIKEDNFVIKYQKLKL